MKGRWVSFLATTACLALALTAPAQDRGRRGGGGGGGGGGESRPTRSGGGGGESRPSRGGGESSPSRSGGGESRPTRSGGGESSPTRSGGGESRPSRSGGGDSGGGSIPTRGGDVRPARGGGEMSPSRTVGGGSDRGRSSSSRGGWLGGFVPSEQIARPVHARPSRSGSVNYGTLSNGFGNARPARYSGGFTRNVLGVQIRRTDARQGYNVVYGNVFGGLRVGYVGYNNYWRDDYFCYPFYVFNPWAPNTLCVASPWYRYSYLPPYINTTRVIVVNNYASSWDAPGWNNYDYRYQVRDTRDENNVKLGDALDDIRDAFELNSARYGDRVLPQAGQVAVFNDGKYDYSLGAEDFQDMFLDGIEQSKTVKYEILESQVRGDEVRLRARHEYVDSWGQSQVVFHSYTLRRERDGRYVIREFGTD